MSIAKLFITIFAFHLIGLSQAQACVWIEVSSHSLECRTPSREFAMAEPEVRKAVLTIAFKNAKRKIQDIFNQEAVMSTILESDEMYRRDSIEALEKVIADAEAVLDVTNEITKKGAMYLNEQANSSLFSDPRFDWRPSAYMIGITMAIKDGLSLPVANLLKALGKSGAPEFKVGRGSVFFAVVMVPQIVEFIAEKKGPQGFEEPVAGAVLVHEEENIRIYDVQQVPMWRLAEDLNLQSSRTRFNDWGIQAYPTFDLVSPSARLEPYKSGGYLKPTIGLAWGHDIYRPADVGKWGLSYSVPTALARTPIFASPGSGQILTPGKDTLLYQNTWWGRVAPIRVPLHMMLRALDRLDVENVKISFNSAHNPVDDIKNIFEEGLEKVPFDQLMIHIRRENWPNHRRWLRPRGEINAAEAIAQTRFGINFNLSIFSFLGGLESPFGFLEPKPGADAGVALTSEQLAQARIDMIESERFQRALYEELEQINVAKEPLTPQEIQEVVKALLEKLKEN